MSKSLLFIALFVVIAAYGVAAISSKPLTKTAGIYPAGSEDCPMCIDFMVAAVNYYLNEWLQVTLPNDCTTLCAKVDPQHNSTCNLMCNLYGVYEFIQVISRVDIDPIYMCQLEKQCPIKACGQSSCAHITSVTVHPFTPKRGDTLTVTGYYTVTGEAGAGMLRLMSATTADGGWTKGPTDYLVSSYRPGQYKAVYTINTENLQPGSWASTFHVCLGECGSQWPNSQLFDKKSVTWTMPN